MQSRTSHNTRQLAYLKAMGIECWTSRSHRGQLNTDLAAGNTALETLVSDQTIWLRVEVVQLSDQVLLHDIAAALNPHLSTAEVQSLLISDPPAESPYIEFLGKAIQQSGQQQWQFPELHILANNSQLKRELWHSIVQIHQALQHQAQKGEH